MSTTANYCEESVVTVGTRATLPSIYMEDEVSNNLRFRNRLTGEDGEDDLNNNNLTDPNKARVHSWSDSLLEGSTGESSVRIAPSYGTPGTTFSSSGYEGDWQSPDSGMGKGSRPQTKLFQVSPGLTENPYGSFNESNGVRMVTATRGDDVLQTPVLLTTDEKIKETLQDLHRRWRHQQHRVELHGIRDVIGDIFTDLDIIKELMPIVVTTIIIASCFVTICLLSAGLIRNPSAIQLTDTMNGKYKSIEFGQSRTLERRLSLERRLPPKVLKDENGVILGGKKASIQFAYNLRNNLEETNEEVFSTPEEDVKKVQTENEILEKLSLQVASKVLDAYDEISKDEKSAESEEEMTPRMKLLNKIRKFGHFSTTKVNANDQETMDSGDNKKAKGLKIEENRVQSDMPSESKSKIEVTIKKEAKSKLRGSSGTKIRKNSSRKTLRLDPFRQFMIRANEKSARLATSAAPTASVPSVTKKVDSAQKLKRKPVKKNRRKSLDL